MSRKEKIEEKRLSKDLIHIAIVGIDEIEQSDKEIENMEMDSYPSETVKKELLKKIHNESKKERLRKYATIAASIFICIAITTIMAIHADALKLQIYQFWIEAKNNHDVVTWQETSAEDAIKDQLVGWENFYYPEYIPTGYQISPSECTDQKGTKTIVFRNAENDAIYFIQKNKENVNQQLDNENSESKEILIHDYPGILTFREHYISLVWINLQSWFQIACDAKVSEEDIIHMANEIIFIKS